MIQNTDVLTHAQVVATLSEFGDFDEVSGGDMVQNFTDYYEAGSKTPLKISFTGNFSDLTLSRAYVPGRDQQVVDWWKRRMNGQDLVARKCVKKYRNALGIVVAQQSYMVYPKDVATPDGKAGDNTIGMLKVVLVVESVI